MKKSVRFPEDENDLTQITYFGDSCPASPLLDPVARAQLDQELAKMEPLSQFSLPYKVELPKGHYKNIKVKQTES